MTTIRDREPASLGRAFFVPGVLGALLATTLFAGTALADDVTGAANAFSRAQKAELSSDFAAAAEFYELADGLAPAPEALRSALRSRKAAGQLEIAAVHAEELLERYPSDAKSTDLANATLDEASKKLMRFEAACRPTACNLVVDGAAAGAEAKEHQVLFLSPGKHEVLAAFGPARTEAQFAEGAAGDRGSLTFDAPPEAPQSHVDGASGSADMSGTGADTGTGRRGGLSPWYFISGAIVTAGLGGATIWSGLDVLSAHDTYKKAPTQAGYNDGRSRELRTNVFIAATSVVGVATGVIALFTDWGGKHGGKAERPGTVHATASVTGNSAGIVVGGVY
jgi:hypothetical protein